MMESEERPAKIRRLDSVSASESEIIAINGISTPTVRDGNGAEATNKHISTNVGNGTHVNQESRSKLEENSQNGITNINNGIEAKPDGIDPSQLSRNQQKKLRRKLEWESKREDRKVIKKEKRVERKARKRAAKAAAANDPTIKVEPPPMRNPVQLPVTFIFDCNFDDLMREKELISLASQITRSYSDNRKSPYRAHIAVSSFGGKLKHRFDNVLDKQYETWKGMKFFDSDFVDVAEKAKQWMAADGDKLKGAFSKYDDAEKNIEELKSEGEVVYLTADTDETLEELKPYSTYIIGGIVDKNREKGLCYKRATQRGVRTARLPIGDYLQMVSRKVLTTNQVNEIMLKWLEVRDWAEAFVTAIPKRKGGVLKNVDDQKEDEKEVQDDEDDDDTQHDEEGQDGNVDTHHDGEKKEADVDTQNNQDLDIQESIGIAESTTEDKTPSRHQETLS